MKTTLHASVLQAWLKTECYLQPVDEESPPKVIEYLTAFWRAVGNRPTNQPEKEPSGAVNRSEDPLPHQVKYRPAAMHISHGDF